MSEFIISAFADEADANLDGQIEALKKEGINHIEMRGVDGHSLIDCSWDKITEIKKKLYKNNIFMSSVGSYIGKIGITDDFKPHLDKFKMTVDIAFKLGSPNIRIFSFYIPEGKDPANYRDEVMERMSAIIDAAKGSGVNICHENEKGIYGDIPSRVLDLHQTFGGRLKGIFDPANYIQCEVENLTDVMKILLPYIEYMHIKDARIFDGAVVPAGYGDGEIEELIEIFSQKEGQRFLSLEPHLAVFDGFEKLGDEKSIKNEFKYRSAGEAFAAAAEALKDILCGLGYKSNKNKAGYCEWKR